MNNKNKQIQHFSDELIDDIKGDLDNNYFTPVLNDVLDRIPEPNEVLDVGCGNGLFVSAIKNKISCHLTGLDASEHALEQAFNSGYDNVRVSSDFSVDNLSCETSSMDLVICKDVLEHLICPEKLVSEISRVVRSGGYVLLHVPNHFSIIGRLKLLFKNTIDPFDFFPDSERWNFPHIRFYDKESVLKICNNFELNYEMNLSWYFFQPAVVTRKLPWLARNIGLQYTDLMCQGITILFKKE